MDVPNVETMPKTYVETSLRGSACIYIDVSLSCEQGICGACSTGPKAGQADHRD
ncbi:hypothetical protein [Caballeronia mineralivorans]|uniref:hypothetical protein n=1 Tax=Caballeronia mineralivorans TaxID=2010198 RepID=UPI000ABFE8C9|nr:hypothetical protein [Caballeronia mineralivorans]